VTLLVASITGPIQRPLLHLLEWLHSSIGLPWAWAIIALTILVRIVLVPLTVKQIHSMQKMQQHAPQLKAIQQKYKQDKQKQQEELMRFYRENKVNPAASCLPLALQIPVFISLFYVLRGFEKTVAAKYPGSDLGFLGIVPSITEHISAHWSGYLLLAIYVLSQVASTYFMSATMDSRQRYLMMGLPVFFAFIIVRFPMGLMLYWVTTNLWTVGQGLITRRLIPKAPPPAKRTSRTPPRDEGDGNGAKPGKPAPKPGPPRQQRVRRRKKKGPRARR